MKICLTFVVAVLFIQPATAATFRVERDGSAPYTIIQDAVDAAASGDTILIGPGRYNEGRIVTTPGWAEFVRVLVHQAELTIIGAGPQATIIGQVEPYAWSQGFHKGIEATTYFGSTDRLTVSGIRFENMRQALIGTFSVANIDVSDCSFSGNEYSIFGYVPTTLDVRSCQFDRPAEDGAFIYVASADRVRIVQCVFTGLMEDLPKLQRTVQFDTSLDVEVRDCEFYGNKSGVITYGYPGAVLLLSNCSFVSQIRRGIVLSDGVSAFVDGCTFSQQRNNAIYVTGISTELTMTNSEILDVSNLSIRVEDPQNMTITNCFLAHGPQYTIQQTFYCTKEGTSSLPVLDLTNNNWGTTNADSIAAWIHLCNYEASFVPYIGQPVPTEPVNFGSLKLQYR